MSGAFAVSLLRITAGRVFRTSPPIASSNDTSQTSPRRGDGSSAITAGLVRDILEQGLAPGFRLRLARLVGSHGGVAVRQILFDDALAGEVVEEPADPSAADDPVQPLIHVGIDGDGQLLRHGS